jgi:hypothetical protein
VLEELLLLPFQQCLLSLPHLLLLLLLWLHDAMQIKFEQLEFTEKTHTTGGSTADQGGAPAAKRQACTTTRNRKASTAKQMKALQKDPQLRNACMRSPSILLEVIITTLRWVYEMRMKSGTPY